MPKRAAKSHTHPKVQAAAPSNDNAARLGRPAWQGHLRLSLVSCPVVLINAVSRANDISFHLINPATNNRIKMITTDPDTGPISRGDLVKGYEVAKGEYVLLSSEDLAGVKLETTRTLDIERFVNADEIDRLYWEDPYFLIPDGKEGADAYSVIHEAMVRANRVALGRVVMHTRERLMAIEPRGKGLLAYTLRMANEVRNPEDAFRSIPDTKPDKQMVDIALKIVEQQEGEFEPDKFVDRYEEALRALIREKQKGHKPVRAPEPADTNVIDLMSALKKSLQKKGETARAPAHKKASSARRAKG
ncbi:MAG TPA: Ku protein [Rhizomicrobium sp.]|jgi:DNA end-binding protein Ku|nr:Ku protein [Rhizomicrobium sp.]